MFTKSYTSLRRPIAYALTLLLFFCVSFGTGAKAQATAPVVTGSFATTLAPPTGLGTVFQTALDSFGDLLFVDYAKGALYEYPVNGGAVITLLPAGSLGGYANPGIAIGASNDLYVEGNYNNCLIRLPYDTATSTWDGLSTISAANGNSVTTLCPSTSPPVLPPYDFAEGDTPNLSPYYFQPWAITIDPNNNVVVTANNSGFFIFTQPVIGTGATSTAGQVNSVILSKMGARAQSVAEDKYGNIYFVEEPDTATAMPPQSPLPGVLMIPAGSTGLTTDAGLTRVDPNLPAVTGVATDAAGNLYISDSKEGVFFVPNPAGTPQTSKAVIVTPVAASGQISLDSARGIMYVPTYSGSNQVIDKVTFNAAALGSVAAGATAATSQAVSFAFDAAATPGSFVIEEAGSATPDFTIASGGSCAAGTAYAASGGCTVNVTLNPHSAGSVSAKLLMLDASGNILGSFSLHGTGTGSAVQVLAGGESALGAGLKTPSQVAVDAGGNAYVADSGLGAVEIYPKGSGGVAAKATAGTGLKAPTGVAVDGAGDVFIADSGNVIEVPNGPAGLIAAGQITLKSGLGTKLKLATDGVGHLYISDPDNHQVVKLGNLGGSSGVLAQTETDLTGFNTPSAVAVDSSGNLYVADGVNLYEVTPGGVQTTVLTSLNNATGLAVDPSGSVYVAETGGTIRIPNQGGTLTATAQTTVAADVTTATSVAVDSAENVYITDGAAEHVDLVSASASTNFGTLTSTTGTQANSYTILNAGNAPLNISGFTGTADYSETSTTCVGAPVAVDSTCGVTVTFNPGPGDQGTLAGEVFINSDAANQPVGVNVTGTGATLAASTTTVTVTGATVDSAPAVITVAPTSGTGVAPTGLVTLTITGANLTTPVVVTGTLTGGKVTITPPQLPAGTYTFQVNYQGDRVYGTSTASTKVTEAAGAVNLVQPTLAAVQLADPAYPYVLAGQQGSDQPYDGSAGPFELVYPVQVVATNSQPLIGVPIYNSTGTQVDTNYGSVSFQIVQNTPATVPAGGVGGSTYCQSLEVSATGTVSFSTTCLGIDTTNNAIPDLMTSYTITPVYSPAGTGNSSGNTNPNYLPVTGTPISFTALRNPVVQISSNPSSLTVSAGSTASATLTLTSLLGFGYVGGGNTPPAGGVDEPAGGLLNNYSLPVQLTCDNLPAYATCSFTYATPDYSNSSSTAVGPPPGSMFSGVSTPCAANVGCVGPATVTMTITTNVPSGNIAALRRGTEATFAAMFGLGLVGLAFGKKRSLRGRLPLLVCLLICSGLLTSISGCSTKQLGTNSGTVTPAGTFAVLVTAKQVGSRTVPMTPANPTGIVYGNGNQMSLPFTINVTIH